MYIRLTFTKHVALTWWQDGKRPGDPDYLCSLCLERIQDPKRQVRILGNVHMISGGAMYKRGSAEIRLHDMCFRYIRAVISDGVMWSDGGGDEVAVSTGERGHG